MSRTSKTDWLHRHELEKGVTVIELSVVLILLMILTGVGFFEFQKTQQIFATGSAEQVVSSKFQLARQLAITVRRNVTVSLIEPNQVRIQSGRTVLEDSYLPGRVTYSIPTGVPPNPGDISGLINLTTTSLIFLGDGSATRPTGEPLNGVVFLYDPTRTDASTAAAVVIFGATGRTKVFHYDGSNWR